MSQRYLAPTNMFYRENDPTPENGFPEPNTGDHYFNVVSKTIRIYYDDAWHDGSASDLAEFIRRDGSVSMTGPFILSSTTATQDNEAVPKKYVDDRMIVSTSPPSGPGDFEGQVWVTYGG